MPSWILAPDLYLYMMSFGLVYLYLTNRRWGLTVATLLVGVGILAEAFYINYWDLPPYMDLASYDYRYVLYDFCTVMCLNVNSPHIQRSE